VPPTAQVQKHLEDVDAVMVGRAAYHEPWNVLGQADVLVFGQDKPKAACRCDSLPPFLFLLFSSEGRWASLGGKGVKRWMREK
jgi:tRNA-dihydrouridine synthase